MLKKVLYIVLALGLVGAGVGLWMWNKPQPKVEDQKGIAITAQDLYKSFAADEAKANAQYLNKAIEVSGAVTEVEKNQDGGNMLILDAGDATASVQCTMREKGATASKGQNVTIKGFCSGNGITGVSLTDCILK